MSVLYTAQGLCAIVQPEYVLHRATWDMLGKEMCAVVGEGYASRERYVPGYAQDLSTLYTQALPEQGQQE